MTKAPKARPDQTILKHLAAAMNDLVRARDAVALLSEALEGLVKAPFNASSYGPADLAKWRAEHRSGYPSRLDSDPELRAFVLARIDTMTYTQIVQAVADHFPPGRRTSCSGLSRWFRRQSGPRARRGQSANTGYS